MNMQINIIYIFMLIIYKNKNFIKNEKDIT